MIRILSIGITFLLLLCTQAQACLWDQHGRGHNRRSGHDYFYGWNQGPGFASHGGWHSPSYYKGYAGDSMQDAWWGEPGDVFNVVLTLEPSRSHQSLGYMEDGEYHRLRQGDSFTVQDDDGFMWVNTVRQGGWGTMIYSDSDFNFGGKDLFQAFKLTDSPLMMGGLLGGFGPGLYDETEEEMWLIAFNGNGRYGFPGMLAVVTCSPADDPLPTPLPASVLLLASGCTGLFLNRRKKVLN